MLNNAPLNVPSQMNGQDPLIS